MTGASGSSSSDRIVIEKMIVAPDQNPQSGRVILLASLTPSPARPEHWWWIKQIANGMTTSGVSAGWGGGPAPGGAGVFTLQVGIARDRLKEETRQFRDAIQAAIFAYPDHFLTDHQEHQEQVRADDIERQRALEADQAIVDRVMQE